MLHEEHLQVGDGKLFLNVVSKTDQNGSVVFKYDDFTGQGRC
jgi:hypothetical protein